MKIPFGLTLSGLLLKGKDRERARIEYELSGRDKEISLLLLDYDNAELQKTNNTSLCILIYFSNKEHCPRLLDASLTS